MNKDRKMEIIRDLDFQLNQTAVCIGKFDGIHSGHRLLISEAKKSGYSVVMFTFLMNSEGVLYSEKEKECLAEKLGIDFLIIIPFDDKLKNQEPEVFVSEILCKRCDAKLIIVGNDFRFGKRRSGNIWTLQQLEKQYGYKTIALEKMILNGDVVSSTRIRTLVEQGEMMQANQLLCTPYFIQGVVQKGHQLGRKMSTPTANLYPKEGKVLPPYGVYAVLVQVGEKQYEGVGNLGKKPTIGEEEPLGLEVWLFEYSGDLYEQEIITYLVEYIRPEQKFDSVEQLKKQIALDAVQARQILSRQDSESLLQSFQC